MRVSSVAPQFPRKACKSTLRLRNLMGGNDIARCALLSASNASHLAPSSSGVGYSRPIERTFSTLSQSFRLVDLGP